MDRLYYKIIEKAMDVAGLANHLAMNANYRDDVDQETRPYLKQYLEAIEHARSVMFLAVSRQMSKDPTERDLPINCKQS